MEYLKTHPEAKKFKLHNFRGTAMSKALEAGVSYEHAAVAFGCNPATMRQHYIALDEVAISDRVMDKNPVGTWGEFGEIAILGGSKTTKKDSRRIAVSPYL